MVITKSVEFNKLHLDNIESTKHYIFKYVSNLDELIDFIVTESNRYATQKGKVFTTTSEEIKAFLGITILMGYHKLPTVRSYWSTVDDVHVEYVSQIMPVLRFEKLKNFLHFANNDEVPEKDHPNYDRAYKVRHVINQNNNNAFQNCGEPERQQSIDERMVKFKGHSIMRQYIKNKPVKWGFKLWMRRGAKSGYTFEIDVYTGKSSNQLAFVGLGERAVVDLTNTLIGTGCMIFMDNFFSSPYLFATLHNHGLMATATVRPNRKYLPKKLKADKEMTKGDDVLCFRTSDSKLNFIKWKDTRAVYVLSNHVSAFDSVSTKRKQKGSATKKKM